MIPGLLFALAGFLPLAAGHASIWHPSMWGFNVTQQTFPYDNRPVSPLMNMTFDQWWFHGHLGFPPHPEDRFELPAGGTATTEIGCNKGATSFFASSEGGDIRSGDNVCPGSPPSEYHTTGLSDLKGCGLAIAYNSNASTIEPEDFTIFSINQTCVWTRFTDFQVPARMPPCPEGGCTCAFFWIHSPDSGGEQNYMNGFQCNVTGSTSNVALAKPQVPRRCGADPANGKPEASPGNCTYGAKQPFYWFQAERNNMFEGTYSPPFYTDLYNFKDGAQQDIFEDSYPNGLPVPSPNNTVIPTPFIGGAAASIPSTSSSVSPSPSSVTSGFSSIPASALSATTPSPPSSVSAAPSSSAPLSLSSSISGSASSISPPSSSSLVTQGSGSSSVLAASVVTSTSTVISTLVVTVTAASPTSSATSILSATSTPAIPVSPATPTSSPVVPPSPPLVATEPSSPISLAVSSTVQSSSSSTLNSSVFLGATTILLNPPSASAFLPSSSSSAAPVQTDVADSSVRYEVEQTDAKNLSTEALLDASTNTNCKRDSAFKTFRRRQLVDMSAILPVRSHRRLYDRSQLWRIF